MDDRDKMKEIRMAMNGRMLLMFAGIILMINGLTTTGRNGLSWLGLSNMVQERMENPQTEEMEEPEEAAAEEAVKAEESADAAAEGAVKAEESADAAAEGAVKAEEPADAASDHAAEETADVKENESENASEAADSGADTKTTDSTEAAAGADTEAAASTETAAQDSAAAQEVDLDALIKEMSNVGITVSDLKLFGIVTMIVAVLEILIGLLCLIFSNRVDKANITLIASIVLFAAECVMSFLLIGKRAANITSIVAALLLPGVLVWAASRLWKLHKLDPARVYAVNKASPAAGSRRSAAKPAPKKSLHERATMTPSYDTPPTPIPGRSDPSPADPSYEEVNAAENSTFSGEPDTSFTEVSPDAADISYEEVSSNSADTASEEAVSEKSSDSSVL